MDKITADDLIAMYIRAAKRVFYRHDVRVMERDAQHNVARKLSMPIDQVKKIWDDSPKY